MFYHLVILVLTGTGKAETKYPNGTTSGLLAKNAGLEKYPQIPLYPVSIRAK